VSRRHYIACLDLEGRSCLVVGGGRVGLEKARGLLDCDALVTIVAPVVEPELRALDVQLVEREYRAGVVFGHRLVIAATPNREVNRRVYAECEALGTFCNVADDPELCSFILPAIHRADPIAVAISTGGASPALAQHLRARVAELVTPKHAELAEELRALRPWAKQNLPTYEARRDFFAAKVEEALRP
jgi:precorrin-2 dehydrogenase/sirohydrochlorin ferrochelatase